MSNYSASPADLQSSLDAEPNDPQVPTLADIDRIHKTQGAAAADAALRQIREAREARENASVAALNSDTGNAQAPKYTIVIGRRNQAELDRVSALRDAEIDALLSGIEKTDPTEDELAIAKVDARDECVDQQESLPADIETGRAPLNAAMDEWRRKNCIPDPVDPLATEKAKVRNWLKARKRTEEDLPAGFWSLSLEERQYVLYEIAGDFNAEKRAAEQERNEKVRKAAQIAKWGLRPDHYSLPPEVQRREKERVKKRVQRAATKSAAPVPPLTPITRPWMISRMKELNDALDSMTPQGARQLRAHKRQIMDDRIAHHRLRETGLKPTEGQFADKVRCTRHAARNRLRRLRRIWPGL